MTHPIEGGKEASLVERLEDNNWREDEAVSDTLNRWGDERLEAAARIRALEAQASTYREALEGIKRRSDENDPEHGDDEWRHGYAAGWDDAGVVADQALSSSHGGGG